MAGRHCHRSVERVREDRTGLEDGEGHRRALGGRAAGDAQGDPAVVLEVAGGQARIGLQPKREPSGQVGRERELGVIPAENASGTADRWAPLTAYLTKTLGVPVKLGARGMEEIIQISLTPEENAALQKSAGAVKELVDVIKV